jgi:hypothetical protein
LEWGGDVFGIEKMWKIEKKNVGKKINQNFAGKIVTITKSVIVNA